MATIDRRGGGPFPPSVRQAVAPLVVWLLVVAGLVVLTLYALSLLEAG